jgi:hypothetical protein
MVRELRIILSTLFHLIILARSILDQSTEVIIICDENGRIIQASLLRERNFLQYIKAGTSGPRPTRLLSKLAPFT